MTRKLSLPTFVLFVASAFAVVGCGGTGGEAEFTPSDDQTEEELQEEEDYDAMMQEQEAETAGQ